MFFPVSTLAGDQPADLRVAAQVDFVKPSELGKHPPVRRFVGGACNPAISRPGMQLPSRDNTLHAIPPRPEKKKSGPGDHHSRPPGIRSYRSSVASMSWQGCCILIG